MWSAWRRPRSWPSAPAGGSASPALSDATVEIAIRQLAEFEPLDEVPPRAHLTLRTDRPVEELLADVEAWLDARLVSGADGAVRR